jgi:hypothetical protein
MSDDLATKVVVKHTVLPGSNSDLPQTVATVYVDGREYVISAPSKAQGDALDWLPHFKVTRVEGFNLTQTDFDAFGLLALKSVREELERIQRDKGRVAGLNPDGVHCDAQICLNGHVRHCNGEPFDSKAHCTRCGAACIDECLYCREPIHGVRMYSKVYYICPKFCHRCGKPYPWMEDRLNTARELLNHDDKLDEDDREKLWNSLQYVMSDPKADLVPEKKKLITIMLEKATGPVREAILDLVAKTAAEYMKG